MPLFTEFFVDNKATGQYIGGYFADNFADSFNRDADFEKRKVQEFKILSQLSLNSFVRNRIMNLFVKINDIYPKITPDEKFLFGILPIAYATLKISELTEAITNPRQEMTISINLKQDLQYILGKI